MTPFWTMAGPFVLVAASCGGASPVTPAYSEPATTSAVVEPAAPTDVAVASPDDAKATPDSASTPTGAAGPLRAMPIRQWSAGSLLAPAAEAREWLNSLGSRAVRMPVIMDVTALGGIAKTGARVGAAHVPIIINLDDSRLGISLSDRLAGQGNGTWVAAFLEGTWKHGTLMIDRVGEVIAPNDVPKIKYIYVEATP